MKLHDHEKLAHYAEAATDIEFEMPFGFKELEGIHSRTDFDLKQHEAYSGRKLRYYDPETEASYVPYVVETAAGVDRLFLAHLCNAYTEEAAPTADGGTEERVVLKLHPAVAPVKAAVLPLVRKDGLQDKAAEIYRDLAWDYQVVYDEKDSVGRRYRRQDQRGTPYCITVDQDTMQDGTVTVRDRDSMDQERVLVTDLRDYLHKRLSIRSVLSELAQV
jgi:glycyl-tRNA synthetase